MSNRKIIKQILREHRGSWGKETKSLSKRDKSQQRFVEILFRQRHKEIVQFNKKMSEEKGKDYEGGYSNDYNAFILNLKNTFPRYDGFGHMLQTTINDKNPLLMGMDKLHVFRVASEYILNYGEETHERVDVVYENYLYEYVSKQFFTCDKNFFETIWDDVLSGRRNYWNEDVKERMWNELQPEIEERMDDEEWQEEWGINFESIDREEDYFMSYWHYPLQNLGWDELQLCDYYREYLDPQDFVSYFFTDGNLPGKGDNWGKLPFGDGNQTLYFIHRNRLFDW